MNKTLCIVTNLFEEVEFCGSIGILRRGGVDIDIFSLHGTSAKGRYGLEVSSLKDINSLDLTQYDSLLIPGGPEYIELENSKLFIKVIEYFHSKSLLISAICAGPTILGHLGYLKGKNYTCFTSMNEDFGGHYIDQYAVRDGQLITGRSAAATIDFAFLILEAIKGTKKAQEIKEQIYY